MGAMDYFIDQGGVPLEMHEIDRRVFRSGQFVTTHLVDFIGDFHDSLQHLTLLKSYPVPNLNKFQFQKG